MATLIFSYVQGNNSILIELYKGSTVAWMLHNHVLCLKAGGGVGGGGAFPEKLCGGVRPASQNPYPIYD